MLEELAEEGVFVQMLAAVFRAASAEVAQVLLDMAVVKDYIALRVAEAAEAALEE